jgi:VWFA-related protein
MTRAIALLVLAPILLVAGRAADPQAPGAAPQFRAGTELVTIDVVATGRDGAPVHGLTVADFELFENGAPVPIQAFQFIDLTEVESGPRLPPGVVSNEAEPGGLFAIVIDEMGVQVTDVQDIRRVADRFLRESLLPQDYVAVVRANADSGFFLATDRTLALDTVSRSIGRLDRGLRLDDPDSTDGPPGTVDDRERGDGGRGSFQVLAGVVERFRPIPARRKAILWFSRGSTLPEDPFETLEEGRPLGRREREFVAMIEAARAANVAIYTIDPRGAPAAETLVRSSARCATSPPPPVAARWSTTTT